MKKNTIKPEEVTAPEGKLMTRKQALRKSGYMALSAATMMLLLNTNAQAASPPPGSPAAPTNNSNNNQKGIWDD